MKNTREVKSAAHTIRNRLATISDNTVNESFFGRLRRGSNPEKKKKREFRLVKRRKQRRDGQKREELFGKIHSLRWREISNATGARWL